MAEARVIGDREKRRIDDLLRQAGQDKVIRGIIKGEKEKEKPAVIHPSDKLNLFERFEHLFGKFQKTNIRTVYSDFMDYKSMQPMVACFNEKPDNDMMINDDATSGGWAVGYYVHPYVSVTQAPLRMAMKRYYPEKNLSIPSKSDFFDFYPDKTSKLSVHYSVNCKTEIPAEKAIQELPDLCIVEIKHRIMSFGGPLRSVIGFYTRNPKQRIRSYMDFNGRFDFPPMKKFPEIEGIVSISMLYPECEYEQ